MKKLMVLPFLVVALASVLSQPALSVQATGERIIKDGEKPKIVSVRTTSAKIRIMVINTAKRTIIFKDADGLINTYTVRKEGLPYLRDVKEGDVVDATKVNRVAIYARAAVGKGGDKPALKETYTVTRAPKGAPRGFVAINETTIRGRVQSFDPRNRKMVITVPSGKTRPFILDKDVQNIDELKPGNVVVLLSTATLTVAVEQ